jgi:hypothetical protein
MRKFALNRANFSPTAVAKPVGSVAGARPEIPQHAAEFCFLNPGSLVRVRPRVGSASTKGNCHSPDLKSIYFTVLLNAPE